MCEHLQWNYVICVDIGFLLIWLIFWYYLAWLVWFTSETMNDHNMSPLYIVRTKSIAIIGIINQVWCCIWMWLNNNYQLMVEFDTLDNYYHSNYDWDFPGNYTYD